MTKVKKTFFKISFHIYPTVSLKATSSGTLSSLVMGFKDPMKSMPERRRGGSECEATYPAFYLFLPCFGLKNLNLHTLNHLVPFAWILLQLSNLWRMDTSVDLRLPLFSREASSVFACKKGLRNSIFKVWVIKNFACFPLKLLLVEQFF